ncbi:MAG: PTS transporter subunit EIIC [Candidatus Nanopelagicales bacterium]|jgi:PTS system N-acetylglucosamine-specific IIC component|nr:PTS transporter subunit EIIC [Candidatus Nanopelagicales bacterium]
MSTATTGAKKGLGSTIFAALQRIGKSLMLPIAVLPAAGLLLRLGQDDLLGGVWEPFTILAKAGGAIFDNLDMLFAVGVAIGYAKKSDGSTALAGLVGFLVYRGVLTYFSIANDDLAAQVDAAGLTGSVTVPPAETVNPFVFGGIVIGITSAILWEKYHRTKLPAALAFFSGRRLVPMLTAVAGMLWAIVFGFVWPPIGDALNSMATWMYDNGEIGAGVYGIMNRLLIPFGLHHIINSFVWFQAGECPTATGVTNGDLNCFFNATGDRSQYGLFMTGFFPIMMFALPAAAFAMVHEARDKMAASVLPAAALVAFLTGVTEPLEFSFMFVAPLLYGLHAVMTGISMAVSYGLGARQGFTFSAGAFDFVLNWNIATKPWLLLIIGAVLAPIYYFLFRFVIRKWNLRTPGREEDAAAEDAALVAP